MDGSDLNVHFQLDTPVNSFQWEHVPERQTEGVHNDSKRREAAAVRKCKRKEKCAFFLENKLKP